MKKQLSRKLSLSKETLRNLSERDLQAVVGGGTRSGQCTPSACTSDTCISCEPGTTNCTSVCTVYCGTEYC